MTDSQTKLSKLVRLVHKLYKESYESIGVDTKDLKYFVSIQDNFPAWDYIHQLYYNKIKSVKGKRLKKRYNLKITNIETIDQSIIDNLFCGINMHESKKNKVIEYSIHHRYGVQKIHFEIDGKQEFIIVASFKNWMIRNAEIVTIVAFDPNVYFKFINLIKQVQESIKKPKPGIYKLGYSDFTGLQITPYKGYKPINMYISPEGKIDNPSFQKLYNSIDNYFNGNAPKVIDGKPNIRKHLLYGPKGTGKTTALLELFHKYKDTHIIGICTDYRAMMSFLMYCSYYNMPCMIGFEELESFANKKYDDLSSIKDMLDGTGLPIMESLLSTKKLSNLKIDMVEQLKKDAKISNKKPRKNEPKWVGAAIIYTTNYPDKIERTIIHRRTGVPISFPKIDIQDSDYQIFHSLDANLKSFNISDIIDTSKLYEIIKTIINENYQNVKSLSYFDLFQLCETLQNDIQTYKMINDKTTLTELDIRKISIKNYVIDFFQSREEIDNFNSENENF